MNEPSPGRADEGDDREYRRVAVVTFCEARGIDDHDAAMGVVIALNDLMRPGTTIPLRHHNPLLGEEDVRICDHMDAGMALGNGYLWAAPTSRAFRMHRFPWSEPEADE